MTVANDILSSFVFQELHGFRRGQVEIVDTYIDLYMFPDGSVVSYSKFDHPKLFLPKFNDVVSVDIEKKTVPCELIFDKRTELIKLPHAGKLVRVRWHDVIGEWIISIDNKIFANASIPKGITGLEVIHSLDKTKAHTFYLSSTHLYAVCSYSPVGLTLRRDVIGNFPDTFKLISIKDIERVCKEEVTAVMYYHPLVKEVYMLYTIPNQRNMLLEYEFVSAFYNNFAIRSSNPILENRLRELPQFLYKKIIYENSMNSTINEFNVISQIKAKMAQSPREAVYSIINQVLATLPPQYILDLIDTMMSNARANIK